MLITLGTLLIDRVPADNWDFLSTARGPREHALSREEVVANQAEKRAGRGR